MADSELFSMALGDVEDRLDHEGYIRGEVHFVLIVFALVGQEVVELEVFFVGNLFFVAGPHSFDDVHCLAVDGDWVVYEV